MPGFELSLIYIYSFWGMLFGRKWRGSLWDIYQRLNDLRYNLNQCSALVQGILLVFPHILKTSAILPQATVFPVRPTSLTRAFSMKSSLMLETRLNSSRICILDMQGISLVRALATRRSVTIWLFLLKGAKMARIAMKDLWTRWYVWTYLDRWEVDLVDMEGHTNLVWRYR